MADRHWWVVSPEVGGGVRWYSDGSAEPIESYRDVVSVAARTKREAVRLGVTAMKDRPKEARSDGINPFAGVTAKDARCPHGFCSCDLDQCDVNAELDNRDYCEACIAIALIVSAVYG